MKNFWLTVFFIGITVCTFAQQNHFIYIQSDSKMPFKVEVNGKSYQATDIGYLIIPKLTNNDYLLQVAFPDDGSKITFPCKVENNDQGFLLKNMGEKGWALLNLQTGNTITAGNKTEVEKTTSAFTDMLSDVVHDSTLANSVIETKTVKPEDTVVKDETVSMAEQTANLNQLPVLATVSTGSNTISKMAETSDNNGLHYIFLDFDGQKYDTVYVTIPVTQKQSDEKITSNTATTNTEVTNNENPVIEDTISPEKGNGNPFYNKQEEVKQDENIPPAQMNTTPEINNAGPQRNTCALQFPDDDMDRLRKKMVSQATDEKMIAAAIKFIGNRCVTTAQVKLLSGLFLNDASRYNLFSALYPNVVDYANYKSLDGLLLDTYYRKRFEALISE